MHCVWNKTLLLPFKLILRHVKQSYLYISKSIANHAFIQDSNHDQGQGQHENDMHSIMYVFLHYRHL